MENDAQPNSFGRGETSRLGRPFPLFRLPDSAPRPIERVRRWSGEAAQNLSGEVRYLRQRLCLTLTKPQAEFVLDQGQCASMFWHGCGEPKLTDPAEVNWFFSKCIETDAAFEKDEADWTDDDRRALAMADEALHTFASIISAVPATTGFTKALASYDRALAATRLRPWDHGYEKFISNQAHEFAKHIMGVHMFRAHDCLPSVEPDAKWRANAHERIKDVVARFYDMCCIEAHGLELPVEAFRYCVEQASFGRNGIVCVIQSLNTFWESNGQLGLCGDGDVDALIFAFSRSRLETPRAGDTDDETLASTFFDHEVLIEFCEYLAASDDLTSPFCVALSNYAPDGPYTTSLERSAKFTHEYVERRAGRFDLIRYVPY